MRSKRYPVVGSRKRIDKYGLMYMVVAIHTQLNRCQANVGGNILGMSVNYMKETDRI